jgi:hypothetical protein
MVTLTAMWYRNPWICRTHRMADIWLVHIVEFSHSRIFAFSYPRIFGSQHSRTASTIQILSLFKKKILSPFLVILTVADFGLSLYVTLRILRETSIHLHLPAPLFRNIVSLNLAVRKILEVILGRSRVQPSVAECGVSSSSHREAEADSAVIWSSFYSENSDWGWKNSAQWRKWILARMF